MNYDGSLNENGNNVNNENVVVRPALPCYAGNFSQVRKISAMGKGTVFLPQKENTYRQNEQDIGDFLFIGDT